MLVAQTDLPTVLSQSSGWPTVTPRGGPTPTPMASGGAARVTASSSTAFTASPVSPVPLVPLASPASPVSPGSTGVPTGASNAQAASTDYAVQQVLALINKARSEQGLAPYTLLSGLTQAAVAHNKVMIGGCGMRHQCPGEPDPQQRDAAQGVSDGGWENIGCDGPIENDPKAIAEAALVNAQDMLNEKAPNDGHRRNLLNPTTSRIGIAIERDANGREWQTQDISR